jgi:hypothetical protein
MGAVWKFIPMFLKYLVNIGPLVYEATKWGIRVVREFRSGRKTPPIVDPPSDQSSPPAKPDLDPG